LSLIVTHKELAITQQNATIGFAHRENTPELKMHQSASIEYNENLTKPNYKGTWH
jgi:hypothetical protein